MNAVEWIAVDWGTSALRVWLMGAGAPRLLRSDKGMGGLAPDQFEAALLDLVGPYLDGPVPVIACGMVGARQGWAEAPYAKVPCAPPGIGNATRPKVADARLDMFILPGVSQDKPADVMRGEETQIAGYLAQTPDFDGVLCLPGTHTKWVQISAGEIVSFQTAMTGELFALLSGQSVLRHSIGTGWDDAAFGEALSDAMSRPQAIAAKLFQIRADNLLHPPAPDSARARLSGLLIGLELAATKPYWLGQRVALIGDAALCARYAEALAAQGLQPEHTNADEMTLAGLSAAYQSLKETSS
ncbi:2-dehydro-3-deoxygalactonokinase [Sulfitobacter mediterraneus]|uniref:2-dehydro-3-deoxygalactonokinase n=1 Tax=Sulfitobacter mediterraneus TaxID=83219 RepID=UPI001934B2F6|nr:2-dehydro-3-deoxygalactonokinase [Sulfitobacter mediterraneus]MBM1311078.1 2-dehydro-3-deoxygalactonokinase [Sulfitobacter mediterraneus]MBM1314960.1 2-dehydro-3-deoxygalactonokinase [Sulfitobacter mediterraneus]MBM1323321.1 2-dehydro-3-deoxygalactonokinase [Sulfitobacter mediterraneus]MBM1327233.1 2-dehydro-3-deoxygalactonokinase [Sulfitobacter mediterraneus]MBM1398581.1 2-dehydro-3-deoxygalactonokinase [Sulfitobacter mediterraneus]